jgi:hypothetical protein
MRFMARHLLGVFGFGDGGAHEHASVDDQRDGGDHLAEDAKVGDILDAQAGSDGRGQRHHRSRADQV